MPSTPPLSHSVDIPGLKDHEQPVSQPVKSIASSSSRERSINEVVEETLDYGQLEEVQDPGVILRKFYNNNSPRASFFNFISPSGRRFGVEVSAS